MNILFLKHNRYKDVCIQCVDKRLIERSGEFFYIIEGWFWNMAYTKSFNTGERCNLEIKSSNHKEWLGCIAESFDDIDLRNKVWYGNCL
jgi:hypothetical protein